MATKPKATKIPKWKRTGGPDSEIEIYFPESKRTIKIRKFYTPDNRGGYRFIGEYVLIEDDEYADVYKPLWFAKEMALNFGQYDKNGKKVADYSSAFQSTALTKESFVSFEEWLDQK
jgi:hypothetical protein